MIGIIISPDRKKEKLLKALEETKVNFKILDIFNNDWENEEILKIEGFLLYPPAYGSLWKTTFYRRVKYLVDKYKVPVTPSMNSIELYESKIAMYDFMKLNNIPHPKTKIYFNYFDVMRDLKVKKFPLILKADGGSGSSNIKKIKSKFNYSNIIKRIFFLSYRYKNFNMIEDIINNKLYRYINFFKRNNGYIIPKDELFSSYIIEQEALNIENEWRVISIGESFFIHGKGQDKKGFHSGTKKKIWEINDYKVLDFARAIMKKNNLFDISLDIFEDENKNLYVNEIQCIFGTSLDYQMKINGKIGRYIHDKKWVFEEGDFCRNGCNNLRIHSLLNRLENKNHYS